MGSIMDQERPWNKPGYVEPRPLSYKEEMELMRKRLLDSVMRPKKWSIYDNREGGVIKELEEGKRSE